MIKNQDENDLLLATTQAALNALGLTSGESELQRDSSVAHIRLRTRPTSANVLTAIWRLACVSSLARRRRDFRLYLW